MFMIDMSDLSVWFVQLVDEGSRYIDFDVRASMTSSLAGFSSCLISTFVRWLGPVRTSLKSD